MSGPIHARLFRIHEPACTLRHAVFANLAIEGEMAVRIGDKGNIVAAFPVIELHHFVFPAPKKTLAELIANNGINAGAVVPRNNQTMPLDHWRDAKTLSVSIDGATIDTGALWAMPGGATEALHWLRSDLDRFGEALKPGDLVLVGTPLGLHPVKPLRSRRCFRRRHGLCRLPHRLMERAASAQGRYNHFLKGPTLLHEVVPTL
jgi:2-keto-4-pentenoate hydratase